MKRRVFLLAAVLALIIHIPVFAEGNNLVRNPGFEEGTPADIYFWMTGMWDTKAGATEFKLDDTQKHSGAKSVCIINNSANDSRYRQEVKVKPNTYYKLSCWIKAENVTATGRGANISTESIFETSRDIKGTNSEWEYVELYGKTGGSQQSVNITLGLGGYDGPNTGKAWFDDVAVEELTALPSGKAAVNLFQDNTDIAGKPDNGGTAAWIIFALLSLLLAAGLVYYARKARKAGAPDAAVSKAGSRTGANEIKIFKLQLDRKDIIIMASMTLVYAVIALVNLGSFDVPKTSWKAANPGESFVIDLGGEADVSRIYYYSAAGEGRYRVEFLDNKTGKYSPLTTIEKKDFYAWKYVTVGARTSRLKVIVDNPGGTLNEMGIFAGESQKPLSGIRIAERNVDSKDQGTLENLFDEQNIIEYRPSFMTGTYFDEIYHARTAYEHIHKMEPYESTHPPLGKLLIAVGILIFGMNTFGWRIVGMLFGAAMIPLMYLFGKKLFEQRFYGFCAAFLMMFDFMHFVQTRIATIDTYGTFFVILMYYYIYDYYMNKSYALGFKKSLKPLFLSGLFFGIGAASKWVCLYGAGGLALLLALAKYSEYRDYVKASNKKSAKAGWVKNFIPLYMNGTAVYCVLFFIAIPAIIYIASYIPFMMVPGPGHGLKDVFTYQVNMFNYHKNLVADHYFKSPWYQWPFMWKPIWLYAGAGLSEGKVSSIVSMGNPAIWWAGIVAFVAAIYIAAVRKDKKMMVVFTAAAFQYVPWMFISRITFIYHFFSTVPFMILAIVYVIKYVLENYPQAKYMVYGYLALVILLFIMFYPILSGMQVDRSYVENCLRWFKDRWIFM